MTTPKAQQTHWVLLLKLCTKLRILAEDIALPERNFMSRGLRQPDMIATQLEYFIHHDLDVRDTRSREAILADITNHFFFLGLIQSAQGASAQENSDLASSLLDAALFGKRVIPIVDRYAQQFIYPHRRKNLSIIVFDILPQNDD